MPEAEEGEHMDHPDFRVRKKIFATLWPDESKAVVFADPETHGDLMKASPDTFSLNGWSEKYGALNVHLKKVGKDQFEQLILVSWMRKAPKTLVKNFLDPA
tara:strand:- start:253 stop:555 length:303 start_codon:yes stop_codon:yes gene_type:complete